MPQHFTPPALVTAQVWKYPAATAMALTLEPFAVVPLAATVTADPTTPTATAAARKQTTPAEIKPALTLTPLDAQTRR